MAPAASTLACLLLQLGGQRSDLEQAGSRAAGRASSVLALVQQTGPPGSDCWLLSSLAVTPPGFSSVAT